MRQTLIYPKVIGKVIWRSKVIKYITNKARSGGGSIVYGYVEAIARRTKNRHNYKN